MPEPNQNDDKKNAPLIIGGIVIAGGLTALLAWLLFGKSAAADSGTCPAGQYYDSKTKTCVPNGAYGPIDKDNPYTTAPPSPEGWYRKCLAEDRSECTVPSDGCFCGLVPGVDMQDQCRMDAVCKPQKSGTINVCRDLECAAMPAVGEFTAGYTNCYTGADCQPPDWMPGYIQVESYNPILSTAPGFTIQGGSFYDAGWVCSPPKYLPKHDRKIKLRVLDRYGRPITRLNSPVHSMAVRIRMSNNKWFGISHNDVFYNNRKAVMCGEIVLFTDANGELEFTLHGLRDPGIGSMAEVTISIEVTTVRYDDISGIQMPEPRPKAIFQYLASGKLNIGGLISPGWALTDIGAGCRPGYQMSGDCKP